MMDENGPFVAFSDIFFKYLFLPPIVSPNVPSEISNIISRGYTHDTVWHCQSSFRPRLTLDAKRKTKGKPENLSRVCVGWVPAGLSSALCSPSHKREWIESDWHTAVVVLIAHIRRRPQSPTWIAQSRPSQQTVAQPQVRDVVATIVISKTAFSKFCTYSHTSETGEENYVFPGIH